jgi:hypothetical protein
VLPANPFLLHVKATKGDIRNSLLSAALRMQEEIKEGGGASIRSSSSEEVG